jgi:Alanine-alpha-ketoisovalerate (or valine-pyruvate) aminotransferase
MDDLNDGLRNPDAIMLGGGNPAAIPEMLDYFKTLSQSMLDDGSLVHAMANYDGPQGKSALLNALAELLNKTYGWQLSSKNIMLTNGSQSAFFYLFNLLAGRYADGTAKKSCCLSRRNISVMVTPGLTTISLLAINLTLNYWITANLNTMSTSAA